MNDPDGPDDASAARETYASLWDIDGIDVLYGSYAEYCVR